MKTDLTLLPPPKQDLPYPKLRMPIGWRDDWQKMYAVLFSSARVGVIVWSDKLCTRKVGEDGNTWAPEVFEDLPEGTVLKLTQ